MQTRCGVTILGVGVHLLVVRLILQSFSMEYHDLLHPKWEIFSEAVGRKISFTEGVINLVFHKLKSAIIILFYTTLT